MSCQKHSNAWIGLNGPGFCPVCAAESNPLPNSAIDYQRETVCRLAEERKEFVTDVDGFVYWWPSAKPEHAGHLSAFQLRTLAHELDRRNAHWEKAIETELSKP